MPDDRTRGPKPSWNSGEGVGPGDSPSSSGAYTWNRDLRPGAAARPSSRKRNFIAAGAAGVFLIAAVVALIFLLMPARPPLLVLIGAGYAENLAVPHNAWGLNALERLASLRGVKTGVFGAFGGDAFHFHERSREPGSCLLSDRKGNALAAWDEHAKTLKKQIAATRPKGPIVVFLALHGAADEQSAYFLAEEANPASEKLRIDAVLATLAELKTSQPKILVLDPTAMTDAWNFGVLRNDFARKIKDAKIPQGRNIWILCSSAPGQISWIDDEANLTVFGRAFAEGLPGLDPKARTRPDGPITLATLCDRIGRRTLDWAAERGGIQTPMLLCDRGIVALPFDPAAKLAKEIQANASGIELVRSISPTKAPEPAKGTPPKRLKDGWELAGTLESRDPREPWVVRETPASYAPVAWKTFREALVRREQLAAAGYDALVARKTLGFPATAALDKAISETLPAAIREARTVPLKNSRNASLAMPIAAGEGLNAPEAKVVAGLLDAPDFSKAWKDAMVRDVAGFHEAVLTYFAEKEGDKARILGVNDGLLHAGGDSLPAEVRFLAIAKAGLEGSAAPRVEILKRAIALRRRAERAAVGLSGEAGYSQAERVEPWVRGLVGKADRERLEGEDLLFSTSPDDHKVAEGHLIAAESLYKQAETRAKVVHDALTLRDAARADLPFLARWTARMQEGGDPATAAKVVDLANACRALWTMTDDGPVDDLAKLEGATKALQSAFTEAWKAFDAVVNGPERDRKLSPVEERLARQVPIAGRDDFRPGGSPKKPKILHDAARERADAEAAVRARIALELWGEEIFEKANERGDDSFGAAMSTLAAASADPESRPAAVSDLGPKIRLCGAYVASKIASEMRDVPDLGRSLQEGKEVASGLRHAERIVTLVEPALSGTIEDPTPRARRRRLFELLEHQAERAWVDHYWSEGPVPHYAGAARAYLDDAEALATSLIDSPDRNARARAVVEPLRIALTTTDKLTLSGKDRTPWTSEPTLRLAYSAGTTPVAGAPKVTGHPVARSFTDQAAPFAPMSPARKPLDLGVGGDAGSSCEVTLALRGVHAGRETARPTPSPDAIPGAVETSLFFRGREVRKATAIDLYDAPEILTVSDSDDSDARLMVRGGVEFGGPDSALAIVFDNSKSMGFDVQGKEVKKYIEAANTLRSALETVEFKQGTWVTVCRYGPRAPRSADRTGDTAYCFDPLIWGGKKSIDDLMGLVINGDGECPGIGYWEATPLLTSMAAAGEKLKGSGRANRMLVVLTDGCDSFYERRVEALGAAIQKEFRDSGILLNIVLFKTDVAANKVKYPEFANALDKLKASEDEANQAFRVVQDLKPAGAYYEALTPGQLESSLEAVLSRRPSYTVRDAKRNLLPGFDRKRLVEPIDAPVQNATATPGEGFYEVAIEGKFAAWARAEAGEALVLDASLDPSGGYQVRRGLASARDTLKAKAEAAPAWWLAASPPGPADRPGASFEVVLEEDSERRNPQGKGRQVEQIEPLDAWFEVAIAAPHHPFHLEMRRLVGRSAPTWLAYLPSPPRLPPGASLPRLTAWWRDSSGALFEVRRDAMDKPDLRVAEGVWIEEVAREVHALPGPSGGEKTPQPCLAIRLRVAPGLMARVDSIDLGGHVPAHQEHRFYRSADRVTAIFGPVTEAQYSARKAFRVSTIPAAKDRAAAGFRSIDLDLDASVYKSP